MKNIFEWQRRFRAGPSVWAVFYLNTQEDGGSDELVDLYESEEAARIHLDWAHRTEGRRARRFTVRKMNIHTMDLARERWAP